MHRVVRTGLVAGGALLVLGCGIEFDPVSEVKSLRVLGVQKSAPYAAPGEEVEMRMLWTDPVGDRPVTVAWFSGCFNPPGDFYYGCFADFAALGDALAGFEPGDPPPELPEGFAFGVGDRFGFTMPEDVISSRPPPRDENQAPYGLAYVFFAVCAGDLGPSPAGERGFPVSCYGPDGQRLGPDDFVAGYSAVYSYEQFRNENPIVTGFEFAGAPVLPSCIDEACLEPVADPDPNEPCVQGSGLACAKACPDDGEPGCPEVPIQPVVARESAEIDLVTAGGVGDPFEEQMWIRYYVDGGSVKSSVRLLNDATKGWNEDYGTKFRAPKEPGIVHLWAVVQDNRGGTSWVRVPVVVQ